MIIHRETAELMKKERGKVSEGVRSSVVVGLCKEGRWREGLAEVMGEAEGGGVGGGRVKGYAWARVLRELGERGEERESERVLKRVFIFILFCFYFYFYLFCCLDLFVCLMFDCIYFLFSPFLCLFCYFNCIFSHSFFPDEKIENENVSQFLFSSY